VLEILSPKQQKFVYESTKKWNLAHGPVSCGKTVGTLFRFMQAVNVCPDSQIWMIGHTSSTIYDNAISLIDNLPAAGRPDPLGIYRPFTRWRPGSRELWVTDYKGSLKIVNTLGARDAGSIGSIQGKTFSLVYCDEMTLYPDSVIDMIDTRLRNPHSIGIATMNPSYPTHKLKQWIDKARKGDPNYYELFFTLDDNPYLEDSYKDRIKNSLSGVFYKRNYLGEWCLAEGSIFDFFDRSLHVVKRPPRAADYWIVGVDYGTSNAFAAILIGVCVGRYTQEKPTLWAEKEYYWDYKKRGYQKSSSEFADDLKRFIEPYSVTGVYVDPSAANFKLDLQRRGIHPVNAENDVNDGIIKVISYLKGDPKSGQVYICEECENLIREIEGYVWHPKCIEKGEDEPLKLNDHSVDAFRYALNTHRPVRYDNDDFKKQHEQKIRNAGWRHPNDFGFRGG
jgi:PBSX family phage terminase large subunit